MDKDGRLQGYGVGVGMFGEGGTQEKKTEQKTENERVCVW